jgi:hypothetical protein
MHAKQHELLQAVAQGLDDIFNGTERPKRIGFAVFVFEFGQTSGGRVNYVSNADRADMMVAVKEWLARHEGRALEAPPDAQ